MKKLLSIVAITGLLATRAMASNTKIGIYGGYGAGSYDVQNYDYDHSMHVMEGGVFADNVYGHLYTGLQIGYQKYKYTTAKPSDIILRGKVGVHFNAIKPVNVYGILAGGYGGESEYDHATFGYGVGIGVDFTKHWGIELNYLHTTDNFINSDYPADDTSYPTIQATTNRGEAFIKYSF